MLGKKCGKRVAKHEMLVVFFLNGCKHVIISLPKCLSALVIPKGKGKKIMDRAANTYTAALRGQKLKSILTDDFDTNS